MARGPQGVSSPRRRFVLLGASNAARAISTIVETAWLLWGQPLEILGALGYGRSYGMSSTLLGRRLPGILQCGLWDAFAAGPYLHTTAVVTDVGNDLLYGASVSQLSGWVESVLDRLTQARARIVLTGLPRTNLAYLPAARFYALRTVLFPPSRLTLDQALARVDQLDRQLRRMAADRNIPVITPPAQWYGFDAIHIRLRKWPEAWWTILSHLNGTAATGTMARGSLRRWFYLRRLPPARRWLFGRESHRVQPAGRLRDGTTVAFY